MRRVKFYSYSSTPSGTTVHQANSVASGIVAGIIQCLLWLWMAWKVKTGRGWARVLSTVFFGIFCLGLLMGLISAVSHSDAIPVFLITLVEWDLALWRSSPSGVPSPLSSSQRPSRRSSRPPMSRRIRASRIPARRPPGTRRRRSTANRRSTAVPSSRPPSAVIAPLVSSEASCRAGSPCCDHRRWCRRW